jgi:predicted component of type VI protein secretion system
LGGEREKVVEGSAIVIGRSAQADWSIPDPERVISKAHCRIETAHEGFVLTDLSTNGVRINDRAVGHNAARRLANGDVIKLGDAVVIAEIEVAGPAAAPAAAAGAAIDRTPDGPFGDTDQAMTKPAPGSGLARPQPSAPAAEPVLDDWWASEPVRTQGAGANPVDILVRQAKHPKADIIACEDKLGSAHGGVANLLRMTAGLDLSALARAVETAALVLSDGERRRFDDRLIELLREENMRGT